MSIHSGKSTVVTDNDQVDDDNPTWGSNVSRSSVPASDTPSMVYHPGAVLSLQQVKAGLEKLLEQVNAAITAEPPPYVPPAAPAPTQNASVRADHADVFDTPHVNAKVVGKIAQGAVLPVVLDPSKDDGHTWLKIVGGQYQNRFVQGVNLTMQPR